MYTLSVCAVVKNEASYLEEWIEFLVLQGVEHFYLYDNDSRDSTSTIIERYARLRLVTPKYFPMMPVQFVAYDDCIKRYRNETEWCAFLDCDEFLHCRKGKLSDYVASLDKDVSAVAAHWVIYGSNGHREKSDSLVIERFTRCSVAVDQHVKSIVRMSDVKSIGKDPHSFKVKQRVVDENNITLEGEYARVSNGTADTLRINHYHTKSRQEYAERKKLPDPGSGIYKTKERVEDLFKAHDINEVEDLSLLKFAPEIKQQIQRIRKLCLISSR